MPASAPLAPVVALPAARSDQNTSGRVHTVFFEGRAEIGPEDEPVPSYGAQTFTPQAPGPVGGPR